MKIARLAGLALVAIFAMSAILASTASAFPQILVLPSSSTFKSDSGPGTLKAGNETVFCTADSNTGEITSMDRFGRVLVKFTGCRVKEEAGKKETCTIKSVGAGAGEIVTTLLAGLLGSVKSAEATSEVGDLLEPESGVVFVTLAAPGAPCGDVIETSVEGGIAGEVTPIRALQSTGKLIFALSSSKQKIKEITTLTKENNPKLTAYGIATSTLQTEDLLLFTGSIEIC
jgi:hypothetical protein